MIRTNNIKVVDSYFNLTSKPIQIDRLQYVLIRFLSFGSGLLFWATLNIYLCSTLPQKMSGWLSCSVLRQFIPCQPWSQIASTLNYQRSVRRILSTNAICDARVHQQQLHA